MIRKAKISRKTKETSINIDLNIDGKGKYKIDTGIGFLNHMLEQLSKHSSIDLNVKAKGDTHIDDHHSVEDIAIILGSLFAQLTYPIQGIERFGNATIIMDEASVSCDLDLSNRPFLVYNIELDGKVGQFDVELVEEFFNAIVTNGGITLHLIYERGRNKHHIIEASFKALAVAIRRALQPNNLGILLSTKGVI